MAMHAYNPVPASLTTGNSKLPLRRTNSRLGSVSVPTTPTSPLAIRDEANRWRQKFEETEEKRKTLLAQNEKARRTIHDLERKNSHMCVKNEEMETELFERNESLAKLTTASKTLFKEYDSLKNQYEVETTAMNKALADASNWYRENKVLRRRTMLMDVADSIDEGVDSWETASDSDLENLKESVKNLSVEVAHLQSELNSAKLLEFEATESNIHLTQELEEERKRNERLQQELVDLKNSHEQMLRVSNMMKRELEDFKEMVKSQKSNALILRKEADDYKKERNVLAHRSTLLLQGLNADEGMDTMLLMQEIEELKSTLEDERNKHVAELQVMQERFEEMESNSHLEILEERLKLTESELLHAIMRADKAEEAVKAPPPSPPPPPPPPAPPVLPPPPPPPPVVPLRIKKISRTSPPPDDAASTATDNKKAGVNDEIINQIKGGFFTLRKASQDNNNKKQRETPKAVSEMLNVLGSLRRTKNKVKLKTASNMEDIQL